MLTTCVDEATFIRKDADLPNDPTAFLFCIIPAAIVSPQKSKSHSAVSHAATSESKDPVARLIPDGVLWSIAKPKSKATSPIASNVGAILVNLLRLDLSPK